MGGERIRFCLIDKERIAMCRKPIANQFVIIKFALWPHGLAG